jgi:hypothetical protein
VHRRIRETAAYVDIMALMARRITAQAAMLVDVFLTVGWPDRFGVSSNSSAFIIEQSLCVVAPVAP